MQSMNNVAVGPSVTAKKLTRPIPLKKEKAEMETQLVQLKKTGTVLLFVLPALIPLIVFWIYPICRSIWLSLTDWDFMTVDYNFIGLKNYMSLFQDSRFYAALLNTLIFTAGTLLPTIAGGLGLALLLQKKFPGQRIFQIYPVFPVDHTDSGNLDRVDLDFSAGWWLCQSDFVPVWAAGTEMDQQFPDSDAVRDHCHCMEESGICDDLLSVGTGKSACRIV